MASNKEVLLTAEGLTKMEEKLDELKTVRRRDVAERIKQAIAFGDISENAEYDEAKNEQAFIEGEIATIENMLGNVRVIDEEDITTDFVGIGSKVKVKDLEFGDEEEYTLSGSAEADPLVGKISNESPVGSALMGQGVGDVVEVQIPDGVIKLKILGIYR